MVASSIQSANESPSDMGADTIHYVSSRARRQNQRADHTDGHFFWQPRLLSQSLASILRVALTTRITRTVRISRIRGIASLARIHLRNFID